jgi:acyl-CoA synthetase (AMP-forming)/AMP-acid ligase II
MIYPKLMSYSKLTDQAAAVAIALGELDVRPEDRVLIMLPDGPGFAESFTGAMQQGAVPLPVNPPRLRQVLGWCWPRWTGWWPWPSWMLSHPH